MEYIKFIFLRLFFYFFFLSSAVFAASQGKIKIQDIDTSDYPDVKVHFFVEGIKISSIGSIEASDIQIRQNGWLVPDFTIESDKNIKENKHVFFLLDASRSLSTKDFLGQIKMVKHFLQTLDPYVKVTIISFHDVTQEHCRDVSPQEAILSCLEDVNQKGNDTLLYDAIYEVLQRAKRMDRENPYVFIFTDGRDEGSITILNDNVDLLEDEGTSLFLVGTGQDKTFKKLSRLLKTSGTQVVTIEKSEYFEILESIFHSFENQFYTLTFKGLSVGLASHVSNNTLAVNINNSRFQAGDQEIFFINHLSGIQKIWLMWQRSGYILIFLLFLLVFLYSLFRFYLLDKRSLFLNFFSRGKIKIDEQVSEENKSLYLEGYFPKTSNNFEEEEVLNHRQGMTDVSIYPFQKEPIEKKKILLTGSAELVLVSDDKNIQHRYVLTGKSVTIGLGRDNHIVVNADGISYKHAEIKNINNSFVLFDLISSEGIYLNGKKLLRPRSLSDLDTIRLGNCEFRFQVVI